MKDSLSEFLTRIQRENRLYEDDSFILVQDRSPVVPGHLLLVALVRNPSLADCALGAVESAVAAIRSVLHGRGRYFVLEHGRRSLCVSAEAPAHAHAHVVPLEEFDGFSWQEVKTFPSMRAAYLSIPAQTEYLCWGDLGENSSWHLKAPLGSVPKSIIRERITQFRI